MSGRNGRHLEQPRQQFQKENKWVLPAGPPVNLSYLRSLTNWASPQYSTCIMITAIVCSFLQKHLFVCCFSFHIRNNTIYASFCCVCGLCRRHELWCDPEFLVLQVLADTIESKRLKLQQQTPKARLRLHRVILCFHADLYLNT